MGPLGFYPDRREPGIQARSSVNWIILGPSCHGSRSAGAGTSSSVIVIVLPNKESLSLISKMAFYLTFTIQDGML